MTFSRYILGLTLLVCVVAPAQAQHLDPATGEARLHMPTRAVEAQAPITERGGEGLTLLGRLADGETRGLDLVGTTLYRSNGGYMEALDVSDPEAPEVLGRFLVEQAVVMSVDVEGEVAYVAAQRPNVFGERGSLQIVDVSDPANPAGVGAVTGRSFYDVMAVGTTVYGAALGGGLRIYDASDPAAPAELGVVTVSGGSVLSVDVAGSTAYVAAGGAGLRVIDVSDPAAPAIVGSFSVDLDPEINEFATGVVYADGFAYVTAQPLGLIVVDVSDPANPALAGHYRIEEESNFQIRSVALDGTTAYVGKDDGIVALDVSDPAAITRVGTLDFGAGGSGQSILIDGQTAWVGNRYHGVRVVDVSDPAAMTEETLIENGGFSFKVTVEGGIAYVVDLIGQLRLIDLSDPANPTELGRVRGLDSPHRVDVVGEVAYVAHQGSFDEPAGRVTQIDVSDPANPTVIEVTPLTDSANGVDVVGETAFVAAGLSGTGVGALEAYDAETMDLVGSVDAGNTAWDVRVVGDVAYIATFGSGLTVVDVSDPAAMASLSQGAVGGFSNSLEVDGSVVYLADNSFADARGLTVIDVSDPSNPQEIGTGAVMAGGTAVDVAYGDDLTYVTVDMVGLYQFDVSDPSNVTPLTNLITSDRATGVDTEGELVVMVETGAGVWVFDSGVTVANESGAEQPAALQLAASYPNPFGAGTTVRYHLPQEETVTLEVYDVLGQRVRTLVSGPRSAGWHEARFEADGLANGLYIYRLTAGAQTQTRKVTLAR